MTTTLIDAPAVTAPESINGFWDVDETTYFADSDFVSHSQLEDFLYWRPLYYGRYIAKTLPPFEATADMKLGTAVHALVLGEDTFSDKIAVAPEGDRRTKAGKEAWGRFCATIDGKTVIGADDYSRAVAMANAIHINRDALELLELATVRERPVRWHWPSLSIDCKCKPDALGPNFILDIKTSSSPTPEGFIRQAANLGYHRQAAMYLAGADMGLGRGGCRFVHIVVGKEPPFPCACYMLGNDSIHLGRTQIMEALASLRFCRDADDWRDPAQIGINRVELPAWSFRTV